MTTVDVGDIATLTLTVTPHAGDTTATVLATSPTGVTSTPTATPNGDRSVWTALLPITGPGDWVAVWTVTGTGAGTEPQHVLANPTPPVVQAGQRVYATTADLANYLETAPPDGTRRMLRRASGVIERLTRCAIYTTDTSGFPTDTAIRAAFRDAVCAQVHYWIETGDELGVVGQFNSVSIGSVSLSRGPAGAGATAPSGGQQPAPDAVTILTNAGLLPGSVVAIQTWEGSWV